MPDVGGSGRHGDGVDLSARDRAAAAAAELSERIREKDESEIRLAKERKAAQEAAPSPEDVQEAQEATWEALRKERDIAFAERTSDQEEANGLYEDLSLMGVRIEFTVPANRLDEVFTNGIPAGGAAGGSATAAMIGARPVFSADDEGRFAHLLIDQNAIPDVTVVPRLTGPDKIFQGRVDIRGAVPANAIEHFAHQGSHRGREQPPTRPARGSCEPGFLGKKNRASVRPFERRGGCHACGST